MAQEVPINPGHPFPVARERHPGMVVLWSFLTLGIYAIYWWYQVNRETADLGRVRREQGLGDNPTQSLVAVLFGSLVVVPSLVTLYTGCKRFERAQEITAAETSFNGWIVLILVLLSFFLIFPVLIIPGYIQSELNKVWESLQPSELAEPAPQ